MLSRVSAALLCGTVAGACAGDVSPVPGTESSQQPQNGAITGVVTEVYIGELDPFLIGDVCITYVRTEGEEPELVGVIEDIFDCTIANTLGEDGAGTRITISMAGLDPIEPGDHLDELLDYEVATYFEKDDAVQDEIAEPDELPEGMTFLGYGIGQIGKLNVLADPTLQYEWILSEQLMLKGKQFFGNSCDGVPESLSQMELKKNKSFKSFVGFMRYGTSDWDTRLSSEQLDALETWAEGSDDVVVYYGREMADACGGSGDTSYNLVWDKERGEAIYIVLYAWTD